MLKLPPRPLHRRYPTPDLAHHLELCRSHPDRQPECRHCPGCAGIYALNSNHWYIDRSRRPWADRYYLPFCKRCRIAAQAYRRRDPEKAALERHRAALTKHVKHAQAKAIENAGQSLTEHKIREAQRLKEARERKDRDDRYALARREHLRLAGGYSESRDWVKQKIKQDCEAALRRSLSEREARLREAPQTATPASSNWDARLSELRYKHRVESRHSWEY